MIPYNHLTETAKEYEEKYSGRLEMFLEQFEARELDFVLRELAEISGPMEQFEFHKYSEDPTIDMKYDFEFRSAYYAVEKMGYERFFYSNKRKIEFLKQKHAEIVSGSKPKDATLTPESKLNFNPDQREDVFNVLKGHFWDDRHEDLRKMIETGCSISQPLVFLGNANLLADAFKQLFEARIISGCQKKDLQEWIQVNFQYSHNGTGASEFEIGYLEKIVSKNDEAARCKRPLFTIRERKIIPA